VKFTETHFLKYLMIILGLIVLITTVWASVRAQDFQNTALQDLGGIVFGVMTLTFGLKIDETYKTKAALLSGFILIIGTAVATRELCLMTSELGSSGGGITINVALPFIGVIMGFILSGSSGHITGKKESKYIKLIWGMVIFAFTAITLLMLYRIYDILPLYGTTPAFFAVLLGYICYVLIFLYGIYAMLSYEIKYNMKIGVTTLSEEPKA